MNLNLGVIRFGVFFDDDSSTDTDSSVASDETSLSSSSNSIISADVDVNDENSKKELQTLMDSDQPSDKESLNAKIIEIVRDDNRDLFMYLIANNYKLEVLNNKNQTALHLAWYDKNDLNEILNLIVDFPNYVTENHTDCNGLNYLHIACSVAHESLVCRCLTLGADVNAQLKLHPTDCCSKFTPLHCAARNTLNESRKVMKLLLKSGADVNAVDSQGKTALHLACETYEELFTEGDPEDYHDSYKFLKILVENGSDPSARDNNGNTALLCIVPEFNASNYVPCQEIEEKLKYFLKLDVDFSAINNDGNNILQIIVDSLKVTRYSSYSLVDFSYDATYAKMIKRILNANKGTDVDAKNCFGDTPLQMAVSLMSFDIVKVLLEHNSSLSCLTFSQDDQYCFCCPNDYPNLDIVHKVISMIKLLLKKGWKLTFKDNLCLMKFLIHDVGNCKCESMPNSEYTIKSNLCNLIDYSCALHFEKIIDKVMHDLLIQDKENEKNFVLDEISNVLSYRKVFNLYVDNNIADVVKKYTTKRCLFKESDSNCKKEDIVRMKYTKLRGNVSLYDAMTRHPYRIYGYVKNQNFAKITEQLRYFSNTVKGHIAKSLVRHFIEKIAVEYLRMLLFPSIPSLCCKQILSFMNNLEIVNMCCAAVLEDE